MHTNNISRNFFSSSPDSKQPRSCLRTSHRAERAPVDGPEVAWTCRKLLHRAEVASAVGAGTNSWRWVCRSIQSTAFDQSDQILASCQTTSPPSVQPNLGSTDYPMSKHGTIKLFGVRVASKLPDPDWWTNQQHTGVFTESCLNPRTRQSMTSLNDDGHLTSRWGGGGRDTKTSQSWKKKKEEKDQSIPQWLIIGPPCSLSASVSV